jgi:hypothetical protein
MTATMISLSAAHDFDVSPERDRASLGWLLAALVPVAIFASTVTSLACMG